MFWFCGVAVASSVGLESLGEGDLVITELMAAPAQAVWYRGEWLEIANNTAYTVDLDGLEVYSGDGSTTVLGELLVEPGELVVLATRSSSSTNGGNTEVDYAFDISDLTFRDRAGDISIGYDGLTIDEADYPDPTAGVAWALDPMAIDADENDSSSAWCDAEDTYGDGDLGTPGEDNPPCVDTAEDLAEGELIVTEVMVLPAQVAWYRGQWIELQNTTADELSLLGLEVYDSDGTGFTVDDDIRVAADGFALLALRSSSTVNGGLPDVDLAYDLSALTLSRRDSLTVSGGDTVLDSVSWSSSDPSSGMSWARSASDGTWCDAEDPYGDGDLGTPGALNGGCGSEDDSDGDGVSDDDDCDDGDITVYPGAAEIARDGIDQDCSGDDLCASPTELHDYIDYTTLETVQALCEDYPDGMNIRDLSLNSFYDADLADITDLSDLWCLCEVRELRLYDLTSLEDLDGLQALQSAETLRFGSGLESLTSLEGLSGLTDLGELWLAWTTDFGDFSGLDSLTHIDLLALGETTAPSDLTGLEDIETIDELFLYEADLDSLEGLDSLTTVTERLYVENTLSGGNFTGLESVTSIGELWIETDGMSSFTGLDSLASVESVYISGRVGSSTGIESLETLGELYLDGYSGDLVGFDGLIEIDVLDIRGSVITGADPFPLLESVGGPAVLESSDIEDLGMSSLVDIGESLYMSNVTGITDLDSLESLESVGESCGMSCYDDPIDGMLSASISLYSTALEDVDGLSGLTNAYALHFSSNDALSSLDGLHNLTAVQSDIKITDNPSLSEDEIDELLDTIGDDNIDGTVTLSGNGE